MIPEDQRTPGRADASCRNEILHRYRNAVKRFQRVAAYHIASASPAACIAALAATVNKCIEDGLAPQRGQVGCERPEWRRSLRLRFRFFEQGQQLHAETVAEQILHLAAQILGQQQPCVAQRQGRLFR